MRQLHSAAGRRFDQGVHDPGGPGRWCDGYDDRGSRRRRSADRASGGVLVEARAPVRLLHAGNGVCRERDPADASESDARADPPRSRGQHVPLHRLPEHRPRRAGRGGRSPLVARRRPAMTTATSSRVFGSGIRRREDPRLLTGTARYTADIMLPGMVHAAILRSPHGHARITRIDTTRAKSAPGVVAVFTGADTASGLEPVPSAWLVPDSEPKIAPYPALATDVVRYVGDAVAVVVAETDYAAYDALELIDVDYEPLPAVVDPQKAADSGAPQLHAEAPGNVAFHWTVAGGDIDAAFASADVV